MGSMKFNCHTSEFLSCLEMVYKYYKINRKFFNHLIKNLSLLCGIYEFIEIRECFGKNYPSLFLITKKVTK